MLLLKLNPIEPPWYGPVCPVVWEGRRREVSPYPDLRRSSATQPSQREWLFLPRSGHSVQQKSEFLEGWKDVMS